MAGKEAVFTYGYADLMKLTGRSIHAVHQASSRGTRKTASGFKPDDFESVVRWVFRNASDDFKFALLKEMNFFRTDKGIDRVNPKKKKKPPRP